MSSGSIALPTIYVGAPPPPANDLPGSGSASDAANGQRFIQIQQDLNRALTASRPSPQQVVQGLNDTMSAQADARAAQQQSQFEANMTAAAEQRAASLPPPPAPPVMPAPLPPEPPAPAPLPAPAEAGAASVAAAVPAAAGAAAGELATSLLSSAGQALGTLGGLALRGGTLAGAVLGLGTGNIPSEADEAAMRAETEARLRATGALPGPDAAPETPPAPADPTAPPTGEAVPSLPGTFGPVPAFLAVPSPFDAPGLPSTTLPFAAPPPPATLTPPAAFAPVPEGGAGALPGFTPAPPMPGLDGLTLPPAFGDLPGLAPPPAGIAVPGFAPAAPMPPLPGFTPVDPALGEPLVARADTPDTLRDAAVAAGAELLPDGRARYARRAFDPLAAGGAITPMDWRTATITPKGIDLVRLHVARFGSDPANEIMVSRLGQIASGQLEASEYDLRFYTHELRELERYRALGIPDTVNADRDVWNNAHTATLADYGLSDRDSGGDYTLYHPITWE